jgi:hypothetical protein
MPAVSVHASDEAPISTTSDIRTSAFRARSARLTLGTRPSGVILPRHLPDTFRERLIEGS